MLEKAPRSPLDQDSAEEPATDGNKAGGAGLDEQRHPDTAQAAVNGKPRAFRLPRWRRRAAADSVIDDGDSPRVGAEDEARTDPVDDVHADAIAADNTPAGTTDTNQASGNNPPAGASADGRVTTETPGDDLPTDEEARTDAPRLQDVSLAGGVVLASDWRTRGKGPRRDLRSVFASRMAQARQLADRRPTGADVTALLAKRPTREDLRELVAKRPTGDEVRATLRKHRVLIGGVTVVALFAAADSSFTDLVSDRGPAPGQVQRIAVAYPWQMQTTTPSVRRYLDAVDHGERLREAAVVAAAARATLERARNEAAAAAAGERQPWMGTPPPPAITMTPGEVLPGGIAPGAGGFVLPAIGVFTSGFGQRWGTFHNGIDVAGPIGTPIYAVANGTVIDAGPAQGFGLWVRIRHDDGSISVYGHMYDFFVSVGERVPAGMQIARMGNRGDSTGPHLHFEVIVGGQHVDPQRWLALHGLTYS
ncbi:M23 family metallopeptidase [Nocardia cyriacigeorgica]|uniref:M23 family metallopeptidase n=1 Tax=Nocardia cyriacigeorgica TaxID=135487 RepID=A0A5R8P0P8_9NOCA|nr:M23 family metallopeptidase [Nocardia cyriacigeorgica]